MAAVTMLDRLIESAFAEILGTTVTGVTYHLSHDTTQNVPPSLTIRASMGTESPVQGSGVFSLPVDITLEERYDDVSVAAHSAKCSRILQAFYDSTSLVTRLNATTAIGAARCYNAKLDSTQPQANNDERSISRTFRATVIAHPNSIAS